MNQKELYDKIVANETGYQQGNDYFIHCPDAGHPDNKPSCSVRYDDSTGKIQVHCFSGKGCNPYKALIEKYGYKSPYKPITGQQLDIACIVTGGAIKAVKSPVNVIPDEPFVEPANPTLLDEEYKQGLLDHYGLTVQDFSDCGVKMQDSFYFAAYSLSKYNRQPVLCYPIITLDENGNYLNYDKIKSIYRFDDPFNKTGMKMVAPNRGKRMQIVKKGISPLFFNYSVLDNLKPDEPLFIAGGEEKAIVLQKYGFQAIASTGEELTRNHLTYLSTKLSRKQRIIIAFDYDFSGVEGTRKALNSINSMSVADGGGLEFPPSFIRFPTGSQKGYDVNNWFVENKDNPEINKHFFSLVEPNGKITEYREEIKQAFLTPESQVQEAAQDSPEDRKARRKELIGGFAGRIGEAGRRGYKPEWLIENILPKGTGVLYSARGIGKTSLTMQIAKAVITGEPFLNKYAIPKPLKIAWFAFDMPADRQDEYLKFYFGSDKPDNLVTYYNPNENIFSAENLEIIVEDMQEELQGSLPDLVVIDVFDNATAHILGNMDAAQKGTLRVKPYKELFAQYGCSVLLLGHTNKSDQTQMGGASTVESSVSFRMNLQQQSDNSDYYQWKFGGRMESKEISLYKPQGQRLFVEQSFEADPILQAEAIKGKEKEPKIHTLFDTEKAQ